MTYVSSSTQKDLGYMYFQFLYKYFRLLTCATWGMWVSVAKCFGIHVPSFNHVLFRFDQTEAHHCGKKKMCWLQHVIKYMEFIILKICVPQSITHTSNCTFWCYFMNLYLASVSILSIVMQWFQYSCTMSLSNCLPCILQRTRQMQVCGC
jgi:hypothetical protein